MPSGLKKERLKHTTTTKVKIDHTREKLLAHMAPPPEPPKKNYEFFGGSEGLIGPPLPHLHHKDIMVIEPLLYDWQDPNLSTAKIKKYD